MTLTLDKIKLKVNNEQILQNSITPPWELKKQKSREESLGLELRYFFDMFSSNPYFRKSLIEISKDLGVKKHVASDLMCLFEYRENLVSRIPRKKRSHRNTFICTPRGKSLIKAISNWKYKGIKIPKHLQPVFELINGRIKFKQS